MTSGVLSQRGVLSYNISPLPCSSMLEWRGSQSTCWLNLLTQVGPVVFKRIVRASRRLPFDKLQRNLKGTARASLDAFDALKQGRRQPAAHCYRKLRDSG